MKVTSSVVLETYFTKVFKAEGSEIVNGVDGDGGRRFGGTLYCPWLCWRPYLIGCSLLQVVAGGRFRSRDGEHMVVEEVRQWSTLYVPLEYYIVHLMQVVITRELCSTIG